MIVGAIAGGVASLIVPGRTPGGAMGAIGAIVVGILGGFVLDALDVNDNLTWIDSLVVAILGAVVILYALRSADRRF